jgi:hypothetical protein
MMRFRPIRSVHALTLAAAVWGMLGDLPCYAQARKPSIWIRTNPLIWNRTILFYSINRFKLLDRPAIRKELKIDKDQQHELTKARKEIDKRRRDFMNQTGRRFARRRAGWFKKLGEFTRKIDADSEKQISAILVKEQLERLGQMKIQLMGLWALQDPDVAAKLKITDAQKKQFPKIQAATAEKRRKLLDGIRGDKVERDEYERKIGKLERENERQTLAVLTREQKAQFDKLRGKPFDTRAAEVMEGPIAGEFDQLKLLVNGREALAGKILVLPVGQRFTVKGQYHMPEAYKGRPMLALIITLRGTERNHATRSAADTAKTIGKRTLGFSGELGEPNRPGEYVLKVYGPAGGARTKVIMQTKVLVK